MSGRAEAPAASASSRQRPGRRQLMLNVAAVCGGVALWGAAVSFGRLGLPSPAQVLARAIDLMRSGQLFADLLSSLSRVPAGFALGAALTIPVGFLMGWYSTARGLIEPFMQFFGMIPPLAVIPLAIVTMGVGETPKVFVIFLADFLSSVIATFQGVDQRRQDPDQRRARVGR